MYSKSIWVKAIKWIHTKLRGISEGMRSQEPLLISISCNIIDVPEAKWYKIKAKIWMNKPKQCNSRKGCGRKLRTMFGPVCSWTFSLPPPSTYVQHTLLSNDSLFSLDNMFDDNFISHFVFSVISLIHLRGFNLPDRCER